ncbi:MAG: DUF4296 domain-containing protein [Bacteroidia bacterium]|jgi:hypothetical protein|nr:DUF4296 domain-containing protein [Sphingobacteriia bacterium]
MFWLEFMGNCLRLASPLRVGILGVLLLLACQGPSEEPSPHDLPGQGPEKDSLPIPADDRPLLPPDSMALAMVRIQLAEAYRARYYITRTGDSRSTLGMTSLYNAALQPMGLTLPRFEASFRYYLTNEPQTLQALMDRCDQMLQQQEWKNP